MTHCGRCAMTDEKLHSVYVSLPGGQVHRCAAILNSITMLGTSVTMLSEHAKQAAGANLHQANFIGIFEHF